MTSTPPAEKADPKIIDALKKRLRREQEILAGDLPTTRERLTGLPPLGGSEANDRRVFLQQLLSSRKLAAEFVPVVEQARDDGSEISVLSALAVLEPISDLIDATTRLRLILAVGGHSDSIADVEKSIEMTIKTAWRIDVIDFVYADAFAAGLHRPAGDDSDVSEIVETGLEYLRRDASRYIAFDLARDEVENADEVAAAETAAPDDALDELVALAHEDRAECVGSTGVVVVPKLDAKSASGGRKDIVKSYETVSGQPLPIIEPISVPVSCATLQHAYPHFYDEIDLIFRQRRPLRLLLVGSPGCGKTSLARDIAEEFGVPSVIYSAGGTADASFSGTSAQWSTARASTPLQLIHRGQVANPVVILDELEKASTSRHNGSLVDRLLSFLEPTSAKRILDPALEVEVDLSAVSYIATANSIDDVPAPLRDRFKIIRMPDPEWKHIGGLVRSIIDEIAEERGLHHRWIGQLAQDELDLVRQAWPGGSLRKLRRIIEMLIDGREQLIGRA